MKHKTSTLAAIIIAAATSAPYAQSPKPACPTPPATEAGPWLNSQYSAGHRITMASRIGTDIAIEAGGIILMPAN